MIIWNLQALLNFSHCKINSLYAVMHRRIVSTLHRVSLGTDNLLGSTSKTWFFSSSSTPSISKSISNRKMSKKSRSVSKVKFSLATYA